MNVLEKLGISEEDLEKTHDHLAFKVFQMAYDDLLEYSNETNEYIFNDKYICYEHYLLFMLFLEIVVYDLLTVTGDEESINFIKQIETIINSEKDNEQRFIDLYSYLAEISDIKGKIISETEYFKG